ncbi:MAG: hypothetical protein JXN10_07905 [Clostridia bacterium]|nr:hypothetical protein [Clostridia bacterium]
MKNRALGFSIIGSLIIIAFMIFVNYTTSPGFPWFIFPAFAVLWWPLGVFFSKRGNGKGFAVIGSFLITALMVITNLITSPGFLWFIFPVFAVLWWPVSMFLGGKPKAFSIAGSVMIIGLFLLTYFITASGHPWFIYPAFAVIWWPLAVLVGRGRAKLFSLLGFLLINAFFITVNLITSPGYLWFIHISYATVWWPASIFLARKNTIKIYSLAMSIISIAHLVLLNYLTVPGTPWFLYSVYPLLLWPTVMYMGKHAARIPFALAGSLIGIIFYLGLNLFIFQGHPWILYLILPLVWWPVSTAFKKVANTLPYLFVSITIFTLYYGLLNIFISPGHFWSLYLLYPYAWAAIGIYFGRRKMALGLAVAATVITALFCSVLNIILTPDTIWAVFPVFAILWWPISVYFFKTRGRRN